MRELQGVWQTVPLWADDMHGLLLALYNMPRPLADAEQVRLHYRLIIDQADREEPPPQPGKRGKPKQSTGRNLLNRLRTHETGVLALLVKENARFF